MNCHNRTTCRLCGGQLTLALGFAPTPPANAFVKTPEDQEHFGLDVMMCTACGHAQLKQVVDPELLFRNYVYVSGTSPSFVEHFQLYSGSIEAKLLPAMTPNSQFAVEIGCLPEGKVINHALEPKEISTIHVGDVIQGLTGPVRVTKTFEKYFDGELVALRIRGSQTPIRFTPNHPIPVIRVSQTAMGGKKRQTSITTTPLLWVRADQIKRGDLCIWPRAVMGDGPPTLDLASGLEHPNPMVDEHSIKSTQTTKTGRRVEAHNQRSLPRHIVLDEVLARLVGYYVAEGSSNGTNRWGSPMGSSFAFHREERKYIDDVKNIIQLRFGLPCVERDGNGKCRQVISNSGLLQSLLAAWCGVGAHNKHLPWWARSSISVANGLLCGLYRGDGSVVPRKGNTGAGCIKLDTVSPVLATQVKHLLHSIGIPSAVVINKPNGYGKESGLPLYSVRVYSKNSRAKLEALIENTKQRTPIGGLNNKWPTWEKHTLVRVASTTREPFSGPVFNLETEDNTYVVDSITVHNSNDGTLLRALADRRFRVLGVEPAVEISEQARQSGIPTISSFFSPGLAHSIVDEHGLADVVIANNVFAHIDDLAAVVEGVKTLLHGNGLFVFEVQYVGDLLKDGLFDMCLPPDEQIVTEAGTRPIGDIAVGDRVLTHLGRFQPVENVFRRPYVGELFEVHAYGQNSPLRVTPEHPVYVRRKNGEHFGMGEFLPAKDLRVGDRVLKPGIQDRVKTPWVSIETKLSGHGKKTAVTKFRVGKDLMRVFGFYLSEGWYTTIGKSAGKDSAAVEFAFGHKLSEEHLAQSCVDSIHAVGGSARTKHTKYGWHVYAYGPLARLLHRELGTGAKNKKIPTWVFGLGDNLVEVLIRSYVDGDGYRYRNDRYLRASTVSDQLAQGVALLSNKIGWSCSINRSRLYQKPKTIAGNSKPTLNALQPIDILIRVDPLKANKVSFENGYQHGTIRRIENTQYSGEVCNLEVAEDHTYTTPLTAVHNCYHEHLSYHALRPLHGFLQRQGMTIVDVNRVPTHGGSIRVWASKATSAHRVNERVLAFLKDESTAGVNRIDSWSQLAAKVDAQRKELHDLLRMLKQRDCSIVGYGAPAKATTYCYQLGIGKDILDYIVDDSPLKQGLLTPGLHIPVYRPDRLYDAAKGWPDYVLVLAWNFADNIVEKHRALREGGTHFIVPSPKLTVTE